MTQEKIFYAATSILAAQCAGGKGEGMHRSPKLVADAVDLAEQLVDEIEKRGLDVIEALPDPKAPPAPAPSNS